MCDNASVLNGKGQAVLLVTLRTPISNGALAAESLPTRLKILGWGDNASVKGNVRLSLLSASRIPQSQKENGFEEIALDFEHNTVPGSPEYERTSEPRAVAAYGTPRVIAGEGLFLENIEWTPAGKTSALNYKDLSPAVSFDDLGNIVFVHSVALTRNGAVDGLSFFNSTINQPNKTMDPNTVITVAELAPAIGLSATATKADVLTRFTIFAALLAALPFKDGKIETLSALD